MQNEFNHIEDRILNSNDRAFHFQKGQDVDHTLRKNSDLLSDFLNT